MSSSYAAHGIALITTALADRRLSLDEVRQIARFVRQTYGDDEADPKAVHAGRLLVDALVKSRGRSTWETDDDESMLPPQRVTAAEILRAHEKAEGRLHEELPTNPVALRVLRAHARATDPDGKGSLTRAFAADRKSEK